MEIKINRDELLNGLAKIQTIVEKKSTMPIISNVLLEIQQGKLKLIATDLEVGIRTEHPAEVKEEGKITIPARKLYEMIREIPEPEIAIKEKEGSRITISAGKIVYNLVGLPADQFPSVPLYEDMNNIEVDAGKIKKLLNRTIFSVSTDDTRFNLSGINMEKMSEGNREIMRMVSSDGHRLSLAEEEIVGVGTLDIEKSVIIPRKGAREILKLCENTEHILLGFKEGICAAQARNIKVVVRLIDGEFPDYKAIIPGEGKNKVSVDRQVLLDVLRRIAILSTEKYKAVSVHLGNRESLEVLSVNPDIGDAREEVDVEYVGDKLIINFNINYLIEVLGVMESEKISIEVEDEASPCAIKGSGDEGFLGIVMPMRV